MYSVVLTDDLGCTDEAKPPSRWSRVPREMRCIQARKFAKDLGQLAGQKATSGFGVLRNSPTIPPPKPLRLPRPNHDVHRVHPESCGIGTDEVTVEVNVPEAFASGDGGICRATCFLPRLRATTPIRRSRGCRAIWPPDPGRQTYLFPSFTTTYTVYVTDSDGARPATSRFTSRSRRR